MATTTTNLQLIMPGGTDKIRIAQINSNMETIDEAIGPVGNTSLQQQITNTNTALTATQDGLAIVATGNTHAAITAGQFVYVKSHGTLSDGLYVASSNIAANGTLSSSNLTADTNGGLNALSDQLAQNKLFNPTSIWYNSADLNTLKETGFYAIGNSPTNAPTGESWGILFVIGVRSDAVRQLYFGLSSAAIRSYQNDSWSAWKNL